MSSKIWQSIAGVGVGAVMVVAIASLRITSLEEQKIDLVREQNKVAARTQAQVVKHMLEQARCDGARMNALEITLPDAKYVCLPGSVGLQQGGSF